jgi:hypothetical protein
MTFKPTINHIKTNKSLLVMLDYFHAGTKTFPETLTDEDGVVYTKYVKSEADYFDEPDLEFYECYVSEIVNPPIDKSDIQESEISS